MAGKDIIMIIPEELKRLHIIQKILDKKLKQVEAAKILDLTDRQVRRIVKRVKKEGDKGIIHKLRGKPSYRIIPQKTKEKALKLCRGKYSGFNPTFASEKLFEINKIKISKETIRSWFLEECIPYKKRKAMPHRQWRERKHYFGEMLQMDGSIHNWLEGRGPECVLMGYIDDATNKIFARFYLYEGTLPAMDSFKRYIKRYGLPLSVYLDKHTTYKSTKKPSIEDELNDRKPLSQFGRALAELGVNVIYANSPQAKGRIERLFETLQDRLIKEMRLKRIKTIEEANNFLNYYLPIFNKRFSIKPIEKDDFHRILPANIDLNKILCIRTEHSLRNDFTIAHKKKLYQILDSINTKKVIFEERTNGKILITYKDKHLRYKEIIQRPAKEEEKKPDMLKSRKVYIPPKDHPWRKLKLPGSFNFEEKEEALVGAL